MNSNAEISGACLCGEVKIKAEASSESVGACHCSSCRKWGGGPLMTIECSGEVYFTGSENISVFDSSDWAERGFCSKCGSHLFYRLKSTRQYIVPIGLFDTDEKLCFDHQVFIEQKPEFYAFSNDTKNLTGEELFAQYSSD